MTNDRDRASLLDLLELWRATKNVEVARGWLSTFATLPHELRRFSMVLTRGPMNAVEHTALGDVLATYRCLETCILPTPEVTCRPPPLRGDELPHDRD